MLLPGLWPVGDDQEQICPALYRVTKQLREPQVVANERRDREAVLLKQRDRLAGHIPFRFPAEPERMHFTVTQDLLTIRADHKALIAPFCVRPFEHQSADHKAAELTREFLEKNLRFAARLLRDLRDVHAESGGEHLGKHDQSIRRDAALTQLFTDAPEVLRLIFPHDIELAAHYVHYR